MQFDSQENKALIWGVLSEQKVFENIPDKLFSKVQTLFETEIKSIKERNNGKNADLLIMNKMLMQNFTRSLSSLKENKIMKAKKIEESFNLKREELNSLLVGVKPKEIDFSDPSDDEPLKIADLDDKLNSIIDERKALISDYDNIDATNNIEILDKPKNVINEKLNDLNNIGNLGNNLELKEEIISEENLEETFLSKLKKNDEISLEVINNKLDKIMEKIDKLSK